MPKKGFVLLTAIILISSIALIGLIEISFLRISTAAVEEYYRQTLEFHRQESESAYIQWLNK